MDEPTRPTLKERLEYEKYFFAKTALSLETWTAILYLFAIFALIIQSWLFVGIAIIFLIILNSEKHVESGRVREYIRKKDNIPTRGQIKKLKEQCQKE